MKFRIFRIDKRWHWQLVRGASPTNGQVLAPPRRGGYQTKRECVDIVDEIRFGVSADTPVDVLE